MMTSGFFRLLPDLPKLFWRYPISYLSYGSWAIQVLLWIPILFWSSFELVASGKSINLYMRKSSAREREAREKDERILSSLSTHSFSLYLFLHCFSHLSLVFLYTKYCFSRLWLILVEGQKWKYDGLTEKII